MADGRSGVGASSSRDASEYVEEPVNINIKTLDSQVFTFRADKKKPVSSLKEDIASAVGVPSGQQRLIFKGKVLKHDHLLSEYNIEDGDTLHLVARQPVQSQSGTISEEARNSGTTGNEATGATPRARIGHSVVLGLNLGDHGENTAVDLSRIIGSVLNSFGVGNAINTWAAGSASSSSSESPGVGTGTQISNGNSQAGNRSPQISLPGTFLHQMVIPDSLTTLLAFISRMEHVLSLHSGHRVPTPSTQSVRPPGLSRPSPDTLITVLERTQQLLSGPAVTALSHLVGRLERERGSIEVAVRGQIQAEAMHVGSAMQHLGSLLLELGRSVSTLRMGETPAESMVNAGPAVYISATGPNPIMVQPVSQQSGSLFSIPFPPIINGVPEVGLGDASRNISVHVNAGGSRTGNGEVPRGESSNQGTIECPASRIHSGTADSEPRSDGRSTVPSLPTASGSASEMEVEMNVLPVPSPNAQREELPDLNSQNTVNNAGQTPENEMVINACESSGNGSSLLSPSNISVSGMPESEEACSGGRAGKNSANEDASSLPSYHSDSLHRDPGKSLGFKESKKSKEPVPLGLGLGGLKSKKLSKQSSSRRKNTELCSGGENEQLIAKGQQVLQALVSPNSHLKPDTNGTSSPSTSNLSSSIGSRTSELVQGRSQNIGGMLSGMIQQMMPVVSQTLCMETSRATTSNSVASGPCHATMGRGTSRSNMPNWGNSQADLQDVVDGIEHGDLPRNIFRSVLQAASRHHGDVRSDLSEALGNDDELINDFMDMMRRELNLRLQSGTRNMEG